MSGNEVGEILLAGMGVEMQNAQAAKNGTELRRQVKLSNPNLRNSLDRKKTEKKSRKKSRQNLNDGERMGKHGSKEITQIGKFGIPKG